MCEIDIVNGFKLRKVAETKDYQDFIIEYLNDGELITACSGVRVTKPEELRKIRKELLLSRIETLDIQMETIEDVNATEQIVVLGAINDFKLDIEDIPDSENKNVIVEFLESGLYVCQHKFSNISIQKIEKIRERMIDFTRYNLKQVQQCRVICLPDISYMLEQIVEN